MYARLFLPCWAAEPPSRPKIFIHTICRSGRQIGGACPPARFALWQPLAPYATTGCQGSSRAATQPLTPCGRASCTGAIPQPSGLCPLVPCDARSCVLSAPPFGAVAPLGSPGRLQRVGAGVPALAGTFSRARPPAYLLFLGAGNR